MSDNADPGVAMATSRSVLRAVITFSISKKEKKEGRRIFVCRYYTSFALFHKQKTIPSNSRELYLSTEYTDVSLDLRLESSDDFSVRIIV